MGGQAVSPVSSYILLTAFGGLGTVPPFETMDRNQKAVLWAKDGIDERGDFTVGAPAEIDVRWNNTKSAAFDAEGNEIALDAEVVVAQDVSIGSAMWLGTLASWNGVGSAGPDTGVMEVVTAPKTLDLKARFIRRTLGLRKYKESPPTHS